MKLPWLTKPAKPMEGDVVDENSLYNRTVYENICIGTKVAI